MNTGLKEVRNILETAILSNYIAENNKSRQDLAFSVILIAEPELNKTRELLRFSKIPNISVQTDLTYIGMINDVLPKITRNEIKTIIIPDLLKCVKKKRDTANNFITILNALIEEGVHRVSLKEIYDFKGARANILTSITPAIFMDSRTSWAKMGFFSRILPFSYSYTEKKTQQVFDAIRKYKIDTTPIEMEIPMYKKSIEIGQKFTKVAEEYAKILGESEKVIHQRGRRRKIVIEGSKGFRHTWQIMALLKSLALKRGDDRVRLKDVRVFKRLSRWINYDFNPM